MAMSRLVWFPTLLLVPAAAMAQAPPPGSQRPRAEQLCATGIALRVGGNSPGAQSYLRRAIEADPTYVEAYDVLAHVFIDRDALDDARAVLSAGQRINGASARLWRLAVELAMLEGDLVKAAEAARALVRMSAHDPAAHSLRAQIARERGAWSEALAATRALRELQRLAQRETPSSGAGSALPSNADADAALGALMLLVGGTDPVRRCVDRPVRRALARCE